MHALSEENLRPLLDAKRIDVPRVEYENSPAHGRVTVQQPGNQLVCSTYGSISGSGRRQHITFVHSVKRSLRKGQADPNGETEIDQHPDKFALPILRIVSHCPMKGEICQPFSKTCINLAIELVKPPP